MSLRDEEYFSYNSYVNKAILNGSKPLQHRLLINKIRKSKPYGKLLDVGCGKGFFMEIAQEFYTTYGVDISKYAIKKAKQRLQNSNLEIGSATTLSFGHQKFDILVCFDLLEHIERPMLTINECHRVLKPDGLLVLSVPNKKSVGIALKGKNWFGYRDSTHISILSEEEWFAILKKGRFRVISSIHDGLWDSPYFPYIPTFIQHILFKFPATVLFSLGFSFHHTLSENIFLFARAI